MSMDKFNFKYRLKRVIAGFLAALMILDPATPVINALDINAGDVLFTFEQNTNGQYILEGEEGLWTWWI